MHPNGARTATWVERSDFASDRDLSVEIGIKEKSGITLMPSLF